jgi:hypothetical protein
MDKLTRRSVVDELPGLLVDVSEGIKPSKHTSCIQIKLKNANKENGYS